MGEGRLLVVIAAWVHRGERGGARVPSVQTRERVQRGDREAFQTCMDTFGAVARLSFCPLRTQSRASEYLRRVIDFV